MKVHVLVETVTTVKEWIEVTVPYGTSFADLPDLIGNNTPYGKTARSLGEPDHGDKYSQWLTISYVKEV